MCIYLERDKQKLMLLLCYVIIRCCCNFVSDVILLCCYWWFAMWLPSWFLWLVLQQPIPARLLSRWARTITTTTMAITTAAITRLGEKSVVGRRTDGSWIMLALGHSSESNSYTLYIHTYAASNVITTCAIATLKSYWWYLEDWWGGRINRFWNTFTLGHVFGSQSCLSHPSLSLSITTHVYIPITPTFGW